MRNIWTIARREYRLYFISPIAYIVALLILLTVGIIFVLDVSTTAVQSLYQPVPPPNTSDIVIAPTAFLFMFALPALSMRLLADEHRSGTLEILLTAPIRDWELVVGKWLGAFLFLLTVIAVTLIYPIVLDNLVQPDGIDQGLMISGYLGLILVAGSFLAIGTAISSFFNNQFAAFFATMVTFVFLWWIVGWPTMLLPTGGEIFRYLDMSNHLTSMQGGIITLADIVYYFSLTALGLFLGSVAIEMRRWQ
ncbi:MAG: ABC transporter permease [Chloroflexota bacterium]